MIIITGTYDYYYKIRKFFNSNKLAARIYTATYYLQARQSVQYNFFRRSQALTVRSFYTSSRLDWIGLGSG